MLNVHRRKKQSKEVSKVKERNVECREMYASERKEYKQLLVYTEEKKKSETDQARIAKLKQ